MYTIDVLEDTSSKEVSSSNSASELYNPESSSFPEAGDQAKSNDYINPTNNNPTSALNSVSSSDVSKAIQSLSQYLAYKPPPPSTSSLSPPFSQPPAVPPNAYPWGYPPPPPYHQIYSPSLYNHPPPAYSGYPIPPYNYQLAYASNPAAPHSNHFYTADKPSVKPSFVASQLCREYARNGSCNHSPCRWIHVRLPEKICYTYLLNSTCHKPECRFKHMEDQELLDYIALHHPDVLKKYCH